ncbi:hypothetical protein MASR2M15_14760 [Anaerolineales bacterium]
MYNKQFSYLYVEDDPLSRDVMELMMRNVIGAKRITILESSDHFVTRLNELDYQPDLILLDIHVKPLDGFQMLEILRKHETYHRSKIIALTASVMSDEIEQLRISGFDGAISKPLSVQSFPHLLEKIIHGESVWYTS